MIVCYAQLYINIMNNNIKIANKLRSSGLRPTKQRVLIAGEAKLYMKGELKIN